MFIVRGLEKLLARRASPETQLSNELALQMTEFYFYYLMRYTALMQKSQHLHADKCRQAWADFHEDEQDNIASLFVQLDKAPGQEKKQWEAIKLDADCTVLRDGRVIILEALHSDEERTTTVAYLTMLPTFDASALIKKAPPKSTAR